MVIEDTEELEENKDDRCRHSKPMFTKPDPHQTPLRCGPDGVGRRLADGITHI